MADVTTADKIVDALLEADQVDPKTFASQIELEPIPPLHIVGSYGEMDVDSSTGEILNRDVYDPNEDEYADIVKFDVAEFRRWLAQNAPEYGHAGDPGGNVDIVDIGFWTKTGEYVDAEPEHRQIAYLGRQP